MIIVIPVVIFSFFFESIYSNFIAIDTPLLAPLFSIISLVIIFPYFNNNDFKYLKYCAIIGLCYDMVFTNTLIFNMIVFLSVGVIIKLVNIFISNNPLNVTLISLIAIVFYRVITYLVLVIINYISFNQDILFKGVYSSLLINIIYGVFIYLVTDFFSRKYKVSKID